MLGPHSPEPEIHDYAKAAVKIIFLSDHNPLCRSQNSDLRAKYDRWIQGLEGLDYEKRYVKGT